MKIFILTLKWRSLFAAALLTTSLSVLAEGDEQAIRDAAADFYQALNSMFKGDLESMEAVWSHAADITYMGPTGGLHLGWSAVLKDWQLQAAMKLGGSVEPLDMQIFVGEQLAITQNYEKGTNQNSEGIDVVIMIRATNIFRKEGGAWKMIGHHTDLLPHVQQ